MTEDIMTKYIFVTGGVVSGLGKGITAASLGRLLKARGLKVAAQKLDPYINVDPGTMSPYQHGEVYVTEDGAETDLDLGHYERFIDEDLNKYSNLTTGKVYWNVLNKERRGEYLRFYSTGHSSYYKRNQRICLQCWEENQMQMWSSLRLAAQLAILNPSLFWKQYVKFLWKLAGRTVCSFMSHSFLFSVAQMNISQNQLSIP